MKNNIGKIAYDYLFFNGYNLSLAYEYESKYDLSYVKEAMENGFKPYMIEKEEPLHIKI